MMALIAEAANRAAQQHGWEFGYADAAAREFERFCELAAKHPGKRLVPALDVDRVWHEMLDVEGVPAHSSRINDDHVAQFGETLTMYQETFGEPGSLWAHAGTCQIDRPAPIDPPEPDPRHGAQFEQTLALYRSHFGEPTEVWTRAATCQVDEEAEEAPNDDEAPQPDQEPE